MKKTPKLVVKFFLALGILAVCPQLKAQEVAETAQNKATLIYDDIKDLTIVRSPDIKLTKRLTLKAEYEYQGKVAIRPNSIKLELSAGYVNFPGSPVQTYSGLIGVNYFYLRFGQSSLKIPVTYERQALTAAVGLDRLIGFISTEDFVKMANTSQIKFLFETGQIVDGSTTGEIPNDQTPFLQLLVDTFATPQEKAAVGLTDKAEIPAINNLTLAQLRELSSMIQKRIKELEPITKTPPVKKPAAK